MKKSIIVSILVAISSVSSFAQGYINTLGAGTGFSVAIVPTGGVATPMPSSANSPFGYYFELLVNSSANPSSNPLAQGWMDSTLTLTNKSAGLVNSVNSFAVPSTIWNGGTTASYMLVGWSANEGTSWGTVSGEIGNWPVNGYYGVSAIGSGAAGAASPAPPFHIFGAANASGIPINTVMDLNAVTAVPEPGTLALAALGGASLLMFRRKK
jgi:hypothetical protein